MIDRSHAFIALLDELARMRGRTLAVFRDARATIDLSELEGVVLAAVAGAAHPPTVPQIGRSLGHPRQVIQRTADALVARGLVAQADNPDHKRARLLVATEAGAALKRVADEEGLLIAGAMTAGLDAALIMDTVQGLRTVREAIEANLRRVAGDEAAAA